MAVKETAAVTTTVVGPPDNADNGDNIDSSLSPRLSLEQQNEKEVVTNPDAITASAQRGVQKAEAAALVWSKTTAYAVYVWVWLLFFIVALQTSISSNIVYYAYADFASAPQISQAFILSSVVSGVMQLPIAKTLNLWGRAEGFLVCVATYTLGLLLMAVCTGPASYAAGYTIYHVGYAATSFVLGVFVADTVGLQNRAFAYSLTGAPTLCTAFVGPLAANAFVTSSATNWRWAYGSFAIVVPATFAPLAVVLKVFQRRAEARGLFTRRTASGRTVWASTVHYVMAFDLVGAVLLMAAFVLVLLPFSLRSNGVTSQYSSPTFIAMLVVGLLLFPAFAVWERFGLPRTTGTPFVQWDLLRSRTVQGACVVAAVLFFNFFTWDQYFYYYIQVVYDLNVTRTGYLAQANGVATTIWSVVFGVWVRQTRHFKHACLFFGAPLVVLGAGLMVHFRGSEAPLGYLVMCQIFLAVGTGTLILGDDMAVMAAADREGVPIVLALLGLCSSLGGALGNAVAAAVYQGTFPQALQQALPDMSPDDVLGLFLGGSTAQLAFPVGSATRTAIDAAWATSQKYECITAAAIAVLFFPAIAAWKDYSVDRKQVKGTVL
ncbi:siderophore iron transporter [Sporothrix brasiliensis 5110]|uniref:Siderophore iron transporter n=1 Tax=Sporothrix brasiliensis 5110 TaxID=1398154 RepID=A0A0C2ENU3_9PEZI|nr:siderophore iron transporter [Sporothrix brasiliensis 5110]KIH87804.1 siderophore iron transporter [Sporothrix brasiliensis 5110]